MRYEATLLCLMVHGCPIWNGLLTTGVQYSRGSAFLMRRGPNIRVLARSQAEVHPSGVAPYRTGIYDLRRWGYVLPSVCLSDLSVCLSASQPASSPSSSSSSTNFSRHTVILLAMLTKVSSNASSPVMDTCYNHSYLTVLPFHAVSVKEHTTRHLSSKLLTLTTMTF